MTFNLYAFGWVVAVAALIVLSVWLDRRRNPPVPKRAPIYRTLQTDWGATRQVFHDGGATWAKVSFTHANEVARREH